MQVNLGYPDTIARAAASIFLDSGSKTSVGAHAHRKSELIYLVSGSLTVETEDGIWVVPPARSIWIPAGVQHASFGSGIVKAGCIFLEPELGQRFSHRCCLLFVHPLVREIFNRLFRTPIGEKLDEARERNLIAVLLDELALAPAEAFHLPLPSDTRALRLVRGLMENPASHLTLGEWAVSIGTSSRTLNRCFQYEVGMSFGTWRQRFHVQVALRELSEGRSVSTIAYALGYDSPSAFIAMFKRNTGQTPGSVCGLSGFDTSDALVRH